MVLSKISVNNLLRNRRRTIATLISIIFGISIMVFTNGYNDGFAEQWGRELIDETQGHFIVRHKDYTKYERTDLQRIYIKDAEGVINTIKENSDIVDVMPRVITGGLISKGDKTSIFISWFNSLPEVDWVLPGHKNNLVEGNALSASDPDGVVLGEKLARHMGAKVGDDLVLMANSIRGDRNAILVHVRGVTRFNTNSEMESNFMVAGFSEQVREYLLEIGGGATELVVRIKDESKLDEIVAALNRLFKNTGQPWEAVPWHAEEAFQTITSMYKGMGLIIMLILSLLVGFVVSNAMMISLYERTREIGTMRAVGLKNSAVYLMGFIEFVYVMVFGSGVGLLLGCIFILIGAQTGVTVSSDVQSVRPVIEFGNIAISFVVPLAIALFFVAFTIRSSNKMTVTEMLK